MRFFGRKGYKKLFNPFFKVLSIVIETGQMGYRFRSSEPFMVSCRFGDSQINETRRRMSSQKRNLTHFTLIPLRFDLREKAKMPRPEERAHPKGRG